MTYAAATTAREKGKSEGKLLTLKMAAVKICKGSLVYIDTDGYATSAAPAASLPFAGVAHETVSNAGGSAGDTSIRVHTTGVHNFVYGAGDAGQTSICAEVYWDDATTDQTVVAVDPGYGAKVGRIVEVVSASEVRVLINNYAFVQNSQAG